MAQMEERGRHRGPRHMRPRGHRAAFHHHLLSPRARRQLARLELFHPAAQAYRGGGRRHGQRDRRDDDRGGMANAIVGTMTLLAMAAALGVPFGVFGGIYLAEYGSDRANVWLRFAADVLNGVPSIVWGMVVYLILVVPFKTFSAY